MNATTATRFDHWTNPAALTDRLRTKGAHLAAVKRHDETVRSYAEALNFPEAHRSRLLWIEALENGTEDTLVEQAQEYALELERDAQAVRNLVKGNPELAATLNAIHAANRGGQA